MNANGRVLDQELLVVPDFAQTEEVLGLRKAFDVAVTADRQAPINALRVRNFSARTEVPAKGIVAVRGGSESRIIVTIRSRIISMIRDAFAAQEIRPEWTVFSEMRTGDSMQLHADAERQQPAGWEENHTPWRTHVGLLYLCTAGADFHGGDLVLPGIGRTIQPSSGLLVSFPSGRNHRHRVTTVESGARLSFVVWFTRDASRGEKGWPVETALT